MNRPFVHERVPVAVRVTQAVGITAAAFFAGNAGACSYLACPSLLLAPAPLLARQWKKLYDIAMPVALGAIAVSTSSFGYLASREPTSSTSFKLYAAAAALMPTVVPYTIIALGPINDKLSRKVDSLATTSLEDTSAEAGIAREETTHALVDKWATRNMVRAVAGIAAAVMGLWATLSSIEVVGVDGIGLTTGANRMG